MCRVHSLLALMLALTMTQIPASAENPGRTIFADPSELALISNDFEMADGAAWDGASRLFVPDVKGQVLKVFQLRNPEDAARTRASGLAISGTCFQLGHLYFADNRGARIAILGNEGPGVTLAKFNENQRPNDLDVDAMGNVYVTFTPEGVVRKITPDGKVTVLVDGLSTPNGIALSPSGRTLYVSSAKTGIVYRLAISDGNEPATAESFAQLPETENGFRGDGMCTDRAGNLYVTGAESVTVFATSGEIVDTLQTPERPINVVLGGIDSRVLFISTLGGLYSIPVDAYAIAPTPNSGTPQQETSGESTREEKAMPAPISTVIRPSIRSQLNVVYATVDGRELLMDVFTPTSGSPAKPCVIVVHGGGWLNGDKTRFRALALRLAERGYVTAAIEYRLGYEACFPAGIRDCNAATIFLKENAGRFGLDPNRISAVGGSAGGHLVGLMAAGANNDELKHPADQGKNASLKAAVVMAGPLQVASGSVAERSSGPEANSNAVQWIGADFTTAPEMYHLADAYEQISSSMPPTLFVSGSLDNPERNQPSRDKMTSLGVFNRLIVHPGAKHGHWNQADWILRVVADVDGFLKQQL
ncbi:SMP-30/gluconolactonase/LRE family protein [Stieleria varia]|uniref:Gluconolactonase n=1 Tax=Stieleria varia TaxID=2528005 RepID=A0A5C6ANR5_9BACT|nr:SMP-30/gluconolactonase/LRE family protein [Stieleria varia]TWU00746.1 Gluconolactonase precursor [Stieleria varia]